MNWPTKVVWTTLLLRHWQAIWTGVARGWKRQKTYHITVKVRCRPDNPGAAVEAIQTMYAMYELTGKLGHDCGLD